MEFSYRIYFDNLLQDNDDLSNIIDSFNLTILRDNSVTADANILRELTRTTLNVRGCAYDYLCSKYKNNQCDDLLMDIKIIIQNELIEFSGMVRLELIEWNPLMKEAKITNIKDNSFSGVIRDYIDNEIVPFFTNTKNCLILANPLAPFKMLKNPNNQTGFINISAFDVLDLFKYLISYFTDNKIEVVSDYLTANKYAITTGFNMHNFGINVNQTYPKVSFSKLFIEMRKKVRLYMSIEKDINNNPFLRIEDEDYFYSNDILFEINNTGNDYTIKKDNKRNFSFIKAGSNVTELAENETPSYPQTKLIAWNKEDFGFCGSCSADKDNILDLTSDFIIDSNIIYQSLNEGNAEGANDGGIFLFNYEIIDNVRTPIRTLINSKYVYNISLNNETVLNRWIDYAGKCLIVERTSKYGFLIIADGGFTANFLLSSGTFVGTDSRLNKVLFATKIYDNKNTIQLNIAPTGDALSLFTCQENGLYNFRAKLNNWRQRFADSGSGLVPTDDPSFGCFDVTHTFKIITYTDNTLTTIIDEFTETFTANNAITDIKSFNIETGLIALLVGNTVLCEITSSMLMPNNLQGSTVYFEGDYQSFELIRDGFLCINLDFNEQNTKPFINDFEYPLSVCDYNKIKANKRGAILLNGKLAWISSVEYFINKNSKMLLLTNELNC